MHATVLSLGRTCRRAVLFLCLMAAIAALSASVATASPIDDAFHAVARTDSCVSCHAGGALTIVHVAIGCDPCHDSSDPTVQAAFNSGNMNCSACHPTQGVDYHTAFTPAHTFAAMGAGCQAVGCHSNSLITAHAPLVGPTGSYPQYADTCALCHMNQDPIRVPAGATADCSSCHASADHTVVHVVERTDECASCHAGGDLIAVHAGGTCDACHASADTAVTAAIAAGQKACTGCHEAGSHEALHVSGTSASCFGAGCHDPSKNLIAVHEPYVGAGSEHPGFVSACALCHDNPAVDPSTAGTSCTPACHGGTTHSRLATSHAPTAGSVACTSCHGVDLTGIHGAYDDLARCAICHTVGDNWSKTGDCANCHAAVSHEAAHAVERTDECASCHAGASLTVVHAAGGCDACHTSTDAVVTAAIAAGQKACLTCHEGGSHDALHVSATTSSCFGAGCHDASKSLVAVHAPYVGEGSPHPEFVSACGLCHDNPAVDPSTAGTNCTPACHSGTTHAQYGSSHTPTAASDACAVCHGADLTGIHGAYDDLTRCAVCHSVSGNWSKSADCANCHSGESHDELHVVTVSPACSGCHSGSSLTPIHAAIGCDGCHESADGRVVSAIAGHQTACAACHDGHPDLTGVHSVSAVSGVVVVTDHGTPVLDCGMCHVSADIRAVHDNDCAVCHFTGGPLTSFATWDQACQQGACHPIAHGSAVGGHARVECAECHLGGNYDLGTALAYCGECHVLTDTVAPVTTADLRPSYSGPAPITLTARDTPNPGGSGVAQTYHIVDGAVPVAGTFVVVAGNGAHTVEFWSVDGAGNVEDTHTAAFVIVADTAPPSTTMQGVAAGGSYVTARSIVLAATDDGSVADTFHQLSPGGPVTRGDSFTAPLPATPGQTAAYTLTYWSVDRSGNEEAHHAVSFSVTNPVDGSIAVNVYNDYTEADAAGQEVWITNGSGAEVARGTTDAMGNWTATVPLGSGYVAHTSTTYGTPFSSQSVPALSTGKPTATVWLMTVSP